MKRSTTLALSLATLALLPVTAAAQSRTRRSTRTVTTARAERDGPVLRTLTGIERTWRTGRYDHATRVDVASGRYEFDCSAMTTWVLRRAAPAAERELEQTRRAERPLARDYYHHVSSAPDRASRRPWTRVARLIDARAGDVIAWVFPRWIRTAMTGHVAFLVAPPRPLAGRANVYVVRVADSSSVPHDDDSRARLRRSGFGYGDIYVAVDPRTGAPVSYRPNSRPGSGFLRTQIALGRPLR